MKPTILSIKRTNTRLEMSFVKNQAFADLIQHLLEKFHIKWKVFTQGDKDTGNTINTNINDIEDRLYHFQDEHINLDIFVGYKKAILVLLSSESLQQQFIEEINTHSNWKKNINQSQ